ncbi:carbonic anhydrase-related protein 10-like [Homarus americanus]|uniref:carbonic anhydrase-related protein 10-like n=1 Tax=Homarus americanus TaxID=6706 RepID=UPI001C487A73|nr:carbonic anhydrase-related protein 10-like [Homarus americanus]
MPRPPLGLQCSGHAWPPVLSVLGLQGHGLQCRSGLHARPPVVGFTLGPPSSSPPGIDWSQWWTYDGISGPRFWGVINPAWGMCREGRRQSPINVDPKTLLFDPNLTPFTLDKVTVGGELVNTGHSVEWRAAPDVPHTVNVSGGPLSYAYTVTHARLHFGERDQQGSEHLLDNKAFPAELQLYGYNSQLYRNFSQASGQVYGVVGIALLIQLGERMTPELRVLLEGLDTITYGGKSFRRGVKD